MMTIAIFLIAVAIVTGVVSQFRHAPVGAAFVPKVRSAIQPARAIRVPAAVCPPVVVSLPRPARLAEPQLEMLEWDTSQDGRRPPPMSPEEARIRDRYLAARFEGAIRNAADLLLTDRVIDVARLYFEEDRADCAHELLALAIEGLPREASLRLARIEIAFLTRDAASFLDAARSLHQALPECAQWKDVQRLGRALVEEEPLFGVAGKVRAHEHYGAWPDTPNWIGACWDLTGDVRAADFHLAMSYAEPQGRPAFRTAA